MRKSLYILSFLLLGAICSFGQNVYDDFEGNGTITTWFGDACCTNPNFTNFTNPYQQGINNSATVLEYTDTGGTFANVRFDVPSNFDLSVYSRFSLKIYVPSSGITGTQPNQISLKLQDGTLGAPWTTQSEIIKPIVLDQWQVVTFNFEYDPYINFDGGSPPPTTRTDFNRIVLQVNGENNADHVVAYIDDFLYDETIPEDPVYDNLVWSDDFDGSGAINPAYWFHQTQLPAGGSWFNGELQHYTNREVNSNVSGGFLNIVAKKEDFIDQGVIKEYTSARLNSKFAFTYGRVEVRAKLPTGVGTWPAIWMLGKDINEVGAYWYNQGFGMTDWPDCGEIDIMEHWGNNQNYIQSALHTPESSGDTFNKGGQTIPTASSQFHVYELEWYPDRMIFSVDGVEHYTYSPAIRDGDTWPFNTEQYILLNVAIESGVDMGFMESTLEIDYVRVYQESKLSVNDLNMEGKVKLFPNPVVDSITIKAPPGFIGAKGTIYSFLGQELYSFVQNNTESIIDLSQYKKGVYFIRFETKNKVEIFKILKL